MMFFADSRKLAKFIGKAPKQRLDYFDLYNLKLKDISVNLYVSRKRATRATHIHCTESEDVIWEQLYPFGGMSRPTRERKFVLKPVCGKTDAAVIVIRGKAGNITGLDEKIKSHRSFLEENKVYLISSMYVATFFGIDSNR